MRSLLPGIALSLAACAQLVGIEDGELRDDASIIDAAASDGDGDAEIATDADLDAALVCDPIAQTGCDGGERCSWIRAQPTGLLGCVPAGTVPLDGVCTVGPVGETTGFDDCVAGTLCVSGRCKDICGFDDAPGAQCSTGQQCTRYAGTFVDADDQYAGACNVVCDPITQRQLLPGSPPCPAGDGCYLVGGSVDTFAICAHAGTIGHNQDITGPTYTNSCVPGAMPRLKEPGSTIIQCGGLCRPAHVTSTQNVAQEGGVTTPEPGDKDNCQSAWGAAAPATSGTGESCRYWWSHESFEHVSPYSNTVGWCVKHAVFQYDTDGDMIDDAPFPRCTQVTDGDVLPPVEDPPRSDAEYFFCAPKPAMARRAPQPAVFDDPR